MARTSEDPITEQLRKLAQTEAAAAKERLSKRTAAARDFAGASATRLEAVAAWERIQGETHLKQAKAVAALLDSDLSAADVAQLLGIDQREVRTLKAAAGAEDDQAPPAAPVPAGNKPTAKRAESAAASTEGRTSAA